MSPRSEANDLNSIKEAASWATLVDSGDGRVGYLNGASGAMLGVASDTVPIFVSGLCRVKRQSDR